MANDFQERLEERLEIYRKNFRIEDLNDANDKSLLHIMLKTELMIDDLQEEIQQLIGDSAAEHASDIKKLADLLRDATTTISNLQRTLAIDRKSRKDEETSSVVDYLNSLKKAAAAFLEERLRRVSCPTCKVDVARFAPIHSHTAFSVSFQCSQCKQTIRVRRDEKDTMHDIPPSDRLWREKHRAEVIPAKRTSTAGVTDNPLEEELDDSLDLVLQPILDTEAVEQNIDMPDLKNLEL